MIPKYPKRITPAVRVYPDLREVCTNTVAGKREYYRRTREMAARQDELCAVCKEFMVSPTFDHEAGRGMAASWRQDALFHSDGGWRNAAVCFDCNSKKGSRRYRWQGDRYLPVRDSSGITETESV